MNWLLNITPDLHLAGFQSLDDGTDWIDPRRVIYDHELMCFAGANRHFIEFDNQTFELGQNSFIIIPPGVWHTGQSKKAAADTYRTWIHFDWLPQARISNAPILTYAPAPPAAKYLHKAPDFVPKTILHGKIPDPDAFFENHRRLCQLSETAGLKPKLLARALLLEILTDLLAPEPVQRPLRAKKIEANDIRKALQIIASQPFAEAPLLKSCLYEQFNRSYEHLCRIFKQRYGTTPLSYIHALRIEKARQILITSRKTTPEVAKELGFRDPIYFHRLFKQHTGQTPGKFRRQNCKP